MKKNESNECFVVNNDEELLSALRFKASKILITKHYRNAFMQNTDIPMPEENFFSGTRAAAGNPLFLLLNRFFSKKGKTQRKIDAKVQKYLLEEYGDDLLLYLRQLKY